MDTPQARIAARMHARRKEAGLSQRLTAERLGVDVRTYGRWERAEMFGFLLRLGEIAKVLGTTESELLGGEDILTAQPTVDDLAAKLDAVLAELAQIRQDIQPIINERR